MLQLHVKILKFIPINAVMHHERKTRKDFSMGLSASQARLLTITARKSDCEFQSMRFSHEKIALSRDLTDISNEYQNSLEATKLVFDYYGTGSLADPLTYGLLMTPSEINGHLPMLTTDSSGKVVLSSVYAEAARKAGIPEEGYAALPSSEVRNKFIMALAGTVMSEEVAKSLTQVQYSQDIGVGNAGTLVTRELQECNLTELIDFLSQNSDEHSIDLASWNTALMSNPRYNVVGDYNDNDGGRWCDTSSESSSRDYTYPHNSIMIFDGVTPVYGDTGEYSVQNAGGLNLGEILSGDYKLCLRIDEGRYRDRNSEDGLPKEDQKSMGNIPENIADITGIWDWMFEQFSAVLDTGDPGVQNALMAAQARTSEMLFNCSDSGSSSRNYYLFDGFTKEHGSNGYAGVMVDMNRNHDSSKFLFDWGGDGEQGFNTSEHIGYNLYYNGIVGQKSRANGVSIDLTNVAKAFLTYFAAEMNGMTDNTYYVDSNTTCRMVENSHLIDDNFTFTINNEVGVNENNALDAAFYDAMFNQICLRGWIENNNVVDKDYLQQMYKNGMMFLTTCSDDGYYYQGSYAINSYIREVTDEEAIARAEAKYNTEKQKINHKEEIIDLKMKNLDTEISSLTTEYETIKSVLKNNIDKSFTRYEA